MTSFLPFKKKKIKKIHHLFLFLGAFEVSINGKNVHSRAQTLAYPDVDQTVKIIQCVSHGGPIPNSLPQKPINDCVIS